MRLLVPLTRFKVGPPGQPQAAKRVALQNTTGAQPMTNLEARIECLPTDVLANVCCGLMNDFRPEADTVFAAALAECQKRMTSPEFLALCDRMEAAA